MLAEEDPENEQRIPDEGVLINKLRCGNPRCISTVEQELDQIFLAPQGLNGSCRCLYCETEKSVRNGE
ncbi:MAG: hypothetical protein Q4F31_04740 [Eubacteriales bacterium]|nr:hypothetical protein [Eubacteriales bacterium]